MERLPHDEEHVPLTNFVISHPRDLIADETCKLGDFNRLNFLHPEREVVVEESLLEWRQGVADAPLLVAHNVELLLNSLLHLDFHVHGWKSIEQVVELSELIDRVAVGGVEGDFFRVLSLCLEFGLHLVGQRLQAGIRAQHELAVNAIDADVEFLLLGIGLAHLRDRFSNFHF